MVTREQLDQRLGLVGDNDLGRLLSRLTARADRWLDRGIVVPEIKAQLSSKGGVCPRCGAPLRFEPGVADRHRCSRCDAVATGDLHRAHWARTQHLWVAERIAELATVGVFGDHERAVQTAKDLLRAYEPIYRSLPNRDNVLGPSHLFFSTYLESIWLLNYLAGATLLRERGWLGDPEVEAVNSIADEAATIIGEFNEGMSNRQTWNSAALTAIGVWFGDDELVQSSVEERTGLIGHLTDGFGTDGMWYEGENYHLFALRGLLIGIQWASAGGADILSDSALARHLGQALLAPAWSALPDFTFPARKDARFGVTLAHPAYLECWEAGLAGLADLAPGELPAWLDALYHAPPRSAATYDAYLHDAPDIEPPAHRTRADLSWWMLLAMTAELPEPEQPWTPISTLLESQGLAILRRDDRYVGLECGDRGGGHGHPDRLQLLLHAGGRYWLPDPGTGSYVTRDLFWYRSTRAHNAPLLNGRSQESGKTRSVAFDDHGDWAWIRGEWDGVTRTVVTGPDWVADLVEYEGDSARLELPWHLAGRVEIESAGQWVAGSLDDEFVTEVERFEPAGAGAVIARATMEGGATIKLFLFGTVLRATGPGLPDAERSPFLLTRTDGPSGWLGAVLDLGTGVTAASVGPGQVGVTTAAGLVRIALADDSAVCSTPGGTVTLAGVRPRPATVRPLLSMQPIRTEGVAARLDRSPELDGSLDGFDLSDPIELEDEMYYHRSEEPYPGPEEFSAVAYVNWDESTLYVAVVVTKPEVIVRTPDEPPLELDNEPDDIHSDGVQFYWRFPAGEEQGVLVRPMVDGSIAARAIPGTPDEPLPLAGAAAPTESGYTLTFAVPAPELGHLVRQSRIELDLVVNEMRSDRVRRAGQLVWGGGGGWVYLRGDRHDPERFALVDLRS